MALHRIALTEIRVGAPGAEYYRKRINDGGTPTMVRRGLKRPRTSRLSPTSQRPQADNHWRQHFHRDTVDELGWLMQYHEVRILAELRKQAEHDRAE